MQVYDHEAEQVVLGTLLQDSGSFGDISEVLKPEDFYYHSHRMIYESISDEIDKGNYPDYFISDL